MPCSVSDFFTFAFKTVESPVLTAAAANESKTKPPAASAFSPSPRKTVCPTPAAVVKAATYPSL